MINQLLSYVDSVWQYKENEIFQPSLCDLVCCVSSNTFFFPNGRSTLFWYIFEQMLAMAKLSIDFAINLNISTKVLTHSNKHTWIIKLVIIWYRSNDVTSLWNIDKKNNSFIKYLTGYHHIHVYLKMAEQQSFRWYATQIENYYQQSS